LKPRREKSSAPSKRSSVARSPSTPLSRPSASSSRGVRNNSRVIAAPPGAQPGSRKNNTHQESTRMTNNVTAYEPEPEDVDGFHVSLNSGRVLKGSRRKWTDAAHWVDGDGLTPPSPLLVVAVNEVLRRWKDKKAQVISDKPLPNREQLN